MSLKGVVQFILHIESYYIIEYPHQGLFSFSTTIYQLKEGQKINAIPYQILNNSNPQPAQNFNRTIVQPSLSDHKAISSTALAKYSDQEIMLDNWYTFRMELQGYPELEGDDILMQMQLRMNRKDMSQPEDTGNLIETVTFRLNDIENGIFNYAEAHFKAPYISKLNFTLFGFISSFKFAKYQTQRKEPEKEEVQRTKVKSFQELLSYAQKYLPKEVPAEQVFYTNYVKKLRISQYLMEERLVGILKQSRQSNIRLPKAFVVLSKAEKIGSKQFKEYLDSYQPLDATVELILHEINQIRLQNFDYMQQLLQKWMRDELDNLRMVKQFETFGREKYGQMVFKSVLTGEKQPEEKKSKVKSYHQNKKIAREMRGKNVIMNNYPIEDVRFVQKREQQELVFYEVTLSSQSQEQRLMILKEEDRMLYANSLKLQYSEKHMLIVLCHGYQGSSYDMGLIKRWIQAQLPDAYYLLSRSNEMDTDGDIKKMGKNLADQIQKYIGNYLQEYQQENVIINLVGHSMGGIIARSAIPHLQKYKHQMGFFCSLSSPHLGYLNGVSGLVKMGLWAIRKFKNIQSLSQLSMEERGDPRKTYLYQLSRTGHLRYFRKVMFVSSFEDSYVSWHSARVWPHRSKNNLSLIEQQMCHNILGNNVFGSSIHRVDINFNVKEKTLDSFIGRTAHINLIIRENLFKTMAITIPKLFDLSQFGRQGLFL